VAGEPRAVRSVSRAIGILRLLAKEERLTSAEVSKLTGFPKSSVHEILITLNEERLIIRNSETGKYSLGIGLFELGDAARKELEVRAVAEPHLRALNQKLDETVQLSIVDDNEVLFLDAFESTKRLRTYSVIGVRSPAYCSSAGKCILAFSEQKVIDTYLKEVRLDRFTSKTIADADDFRAELKKVKEQGFAIDDIEHEEDVRCVGAPVFNHNKQAVAAVSITAPSGRLRIAKVPAYAKAVMATANEVSTRLGFRK
jgi:IclR family transcriptional regulator, KDG regulon repressor